LHPWIVVPIAGRPGALAMGMKKPAQWRDGWGRGQVALSRNLVWQTVICWCTEEGFGINPELSVTDFDGEFWADPEAVPGHNDTHVHIVRERASLPPDKS